MPLQGFLDTCNGDSVSGWAWESSAPARPVYVDIYDSEVLLAQVLARGYRQDLRDAGIGDGRHAFEFRIPATFRDGQEHHISVRVGTDEIHELTGSPHSAYWYPTRTRHTEAAAILRSFSKRYPGNCMESIWKPGG